MASYISIPVDTDPNDLIQQVYDSLAAAFPGWEPADGNLETALTEAYMDVASEIRDLITQVPDSIFRTFGATVVNIPVLDATAAVAQTTWTVRDNNGYTITAGTQVGLRDSDGALIAFIVADDVQIPAGSNTTLAGEVTIVAVNPGAAGSGLGGVGSPVELIDVIDWVTDVVTVDHTAGGRDAELDSDYLDRLRTLMQLLTPRPIIPSDFAALSRTIAGVERAVAIDGFNPSSAETPFGTAITLANSNTEITVPHFGLSKTKGFIACRVTALLDSSALTEDARIWTWGPDTNEEIFVSYEQSSGHWHASRQHANAGGDAVHSIMAFNAGDVFDLVFAWDAATLKLWVNGVLVSVADATVPTFNDALQNIFVGWRGYTASNYSHMTYHWMVFGAGEIDDDDVAILRTVPDDPTFTDLSPGMLPLALWHGGLATALEVPTVPPYDNAKTVAVADVDENGDAVSNTIKNDIKAYLENLREQNFIVNVISPTYTDVDVTAKVAVASGYVAADVAAAVQDALDTYFAPSVWGVPTDGDAHDWELDRIVRYLEVASVINRVSGVKILVPNSLKIGINSGVKIAGDVGLPGAAPLTRPGAMAITTA